MFWAPAAPSSVRTELFFHQPFPSLQHHPALLPYYRYFLAAVQQALQQDNTATYCLNIYYPPPHPLFDSLLFILYLFFSLLLLQSPEAGLVYICVRILHIPMPFLLYTIIPTPVYGPLLNFPINILVPITGLIVIDCLLFFPFPLILTDQYIQYYRVILASQINQYLTRGALLVYFQNGLTTGQ